MIITQWWIEAYLRLWSNLNKALIWNFDANFGLCIYTLILKILGYPRKSLEVYVNEMDEMVSSPIKNG